RWVGVGGGGGALRGGGGVSRGRPISPRHFATRHCFLPRSSTLDPRHSLNPTSETKTQIGNAAATWRHLLDARCCRRPGSGYLSEASLSHGPLAGVFRLTGTAYRHRRRAAQSKHHRPSVRPSWPSESEH